ncbi:hypothetical protein ACFWY9_15225 [Amycolatopsis sp. NPDC059027]|uniref:hypothetical protein n=1 Tax=unclassified Amycolatopsis TaxID=2618356 RepID=UPI00366C60F1
MTHSEPYERLTPAEEEEVVERVHPRVRIVRTLNAVIRVICVLFALILALHIVLVYADANPANTFARFIDTWSGSVSLGLRDLFTPGDAKLRTLVNEGLAAVVWLVIGMILAHLIARIGLPGPRRIWHRRAVH